MVIQMRVHLDAPIYLEQALRAMIHCDDANDVEPSMALTVDVERALSTVLADHLHMASKPEVQVILREGATAWV
jgi:hypothetical protein